MAVNKFKPTEEEVDYFDDVTEDVAPPKDVSRFRSVAGAAPKGASKFLTEEMHKLRELAEKIPVIGPIIEESNIALERFEPPLEEKMQMIENIFPTQENRFIENALERGGSIAPLAVMGGLAGGGIQGVGGDVIRSLLAGVLGQGAKEAGLGPWWQMAAESGPFFIPKGGKQIPLKGEEAELGQFARNMGTTEEELATMLQKGSLKDELAMNLASKGGKVARIYDAAYQRLGNIWDNLKGSYGGTTPLQPVESSRLINQMSQKLSKMPAEVRNRIQQDFNDFIGTQMTGENIMDFWKKMNYYINKGDAVLGTMKPDLMQAAEKISPEFGRDFRLANKLYANFKTNASYMKPDIADKLVGYGEAGMVVKGLINRDLGLLKTAIGAIGGRKVAQELATNPRLQRLVNRFTSAVNRNKITIASKLLNQIQDHIGKNDAEAAKKLAEFSVEDFFEKEE